MPSLRTTRALVALWEFLRPFAIGVSFLLAVFVDVVIARVLWDEIQPVPTVVVCVVAFIPLWLGIYAILSLPINSLIGLGSPTRDEIDEELASEPGPRPSGQTRLLGVRGPVRLQDNLIARAVEVGDAAWTELWIEGGWRPVRSEGIPSLDTGEPLSADDAARFDDGTPRAAGAA